MAGVPCITGTATCINIAVLLIGISTTSDELGVHKYSSVLYHCQTPYTWCTCCVMSLLLLQGSIAHYSPLDPLHSIMHAQHFPKRQMQCCTQEQWAPVQGHREGVAVLGRLLPSCRPR